MMTNKDYFGYHTSPYLGPHNHTMNSQIKVGLKVEDSWYPLWGVGVITEVLKTRIKVLFPNCNMRCTGKFESVPVTYDMAHTKFLKVVKDTPKAKKKGKS